MRSVWTVVDSLKPRFKLGLLGRKRYWSTFKLLNTKWIGCPVARRRSAGNPILRTTVTGRTENLTMPTSRRNMIAGLGALTVGGGAVFGSGAFSSTTADRGLEVEVITDGNIAEDAVDIHVDTSHDGVDISGKDATSLFPSKSMTYSNAGNHDAVNTDVSLIQNDVTVAFGPYLGNADTSFTGLFTLINSSATSSGDFDVKLSVNANGPFTVGGGDSTTETVTEGTHSTVDFAVNADQDHNGETLTIEIAEATSN